MSYVYIRSEPGLWTVGFYRPDGKWEPESDHRSEADAAWRVRYLHGGGTNDEALTALRGLVDICDGSGEPSEWEPEDKAIYDLARQVIAKAKQ